MTTLRTAPKPRRRFGRTRRALALVAVLLGVAALAATIVTRSFFIVAVLTGPLEKKLGGDVSIDAAQYLGEGQFVLRDVRLTAPDVPESGAQVMAVDRALVSVNVDALFDGKLVLTDLVLDGVLLRLSESADEPGMFSFMALQPEPKKPGAKRRHMLPPRVRLADAVIEVGRHDATGYRVLGERRFAGELSPDRDDDGWFDVRLDERAAPAGAQPLSLVGRWHVRTHAYEATLTGLTFDDRAYAMCPTSAREWWQRVQPRGRVDEVVVGWTPGESHELKLNVHDIEMTLPADMGDAWARYQPGRYEVIASPPRLCVNEGTLRLSNDRLELKEVEGYVIGSASDEPLAPVPYRIDATFDMADVPWRGGEDWLTRAVQTTPFTIDFHLQDFRFANERDGVPAAVELPSLIARTLEQFAMSNLQLSCNVTLSREAGAVGPDGLPQPQPIAAEGEALVTDADARYTKFPYELRDVKARLTFSTEQVNVEWLHAKGTAGNDVEISGVIEAPGPAARVDLSIIANDAPIDDNLRAALRGESGALFDAVFDQTARTRLRRSDTLAAVAAAGDASCDDRGRVDLNLRIDRPFGRDQHTATLGTIHIDRACFLPRHFPYPFAVTDGEVILERDRVQLGADPQTGLAIETPAGGRGWARGELAVVREGRRMRLLPDIRIRVDDDPVGPLLYAALSGSALGERRDAEAQVEADDADAGAHADADARVDASVAGEARGPGEAATASDGLSKPAGLVAGLGLAGTLDWDCAFTHDASTPFAYRVEAALSGARATPRPELAALAGASDIFWPNDFQLTGVNGQVVVTPGRVDLLDFTGTHEASRVTLEGAFTNTTEARRGRLDVAFADVPIGARLLRALRPDHRRRADTWWERYRPEGILDARLAYRSKDGRPGALSLFIEPTDVMLHTSTGDVSLAHRAGAVRIEAGTLAFDHLELELPVAEGQPGELTINGSILAPGKGRERTQIDLDGRWSRARLDSVLVEEVMRLTKTDEALAAVRRYQPRGTMDAAFAFATAADGSVQYDVALDPVELTLHVNGAPVHAQFNGDDLLRVQDGSILFERLAADLPDGRLQLGGMVTLTGGARVDLAVEYDGRLSGKTVQSLLPEAVRRSIQALRIDEPRPSRIRNGRLVAEPVGGSSQSGRKWRTAFHGVIETDDLRLGAARLDGLGATIDLNVQADPHQGAAVMATLAADEMRLAGQRLTDASGTVQYESERGRVVVPGLRAHCEDGVISVTADLGVGRQPDYRLAADLAGVSLGPLMRNLQLNTTTSGRTAQSTAEEHDDLYAGEVFGRVTLAGRRDQPDSRTGRGMVRVVHGRIARMPVLMRLLQLSEFMLPIDDALKEANADFYIRGDEMVFEQITLDSNTIGLRGDGTLNYARGDIDMRFRSRGHLAILGQLLGGLSDQLFMIQMTGSLRKPTVRLVPLPGLSGDLPPAERGSAMSVSATP